VITAGESIRRSHNNLQPAASAYLFDLDFYYANGVESEYTIDAYAFGNVTRFINHSCKPNLRVHPCFIETWNPSLHHLAFFAKRDILAGEELSFDYLGENAGEPMRKTNNNNGTAKPKLSCSCGAPTCRGFVY
jgi:histone-lysine N-methyltransferase SUV39H